MKCITFVLLLIPVLGFSQDIVFDTIQHDGISRTMVLNIPSYYQGNEPMPLVFNFHGFGSNASQQMYYANIKAIAEREGFIIAQPQGTLLSGQAHWNVGGWTTDSETDDVGFTSAMIDHLSELYNIDPERIYATGMSNGGFMSYQLACKLGDRIAAIASVTGSMTPEIFNNCNPSHPTPILEIHGTSDSVVPYEGLDFTLPISEVMDYWVDFNNCNTTPTVTEIPDTNMTDGSTATLYAYKDCDNNITNEHYKITGGGHTWPGSFLAGPDANNDIDASEEIWRFFSRFTLTGEGVSGINDEVNVAFANIYPNPSMGIFEIDNSVAQNYKILSPLGELLTEGLLQVGIQRLNLSGLAPGTYLFKTELSTQKIFIIK